MRTVEEIEGLRVERDTLALVWLGGAGFAFKSASGIVVYVDPYLTDCARDIGLPRVAAYVVRPEEVRCDLLVTTHHHVDHFDPLAVPVLASRNPECICAGPPSCAQRYQSCGVANERIWTLSPGDRREIGDIAVLAVPADHGALAPDAIGVIFDFGGITVYHMGDTCLHPDALESIAPRGLDILIPPINGYKGNLNPREAAMATAILKPRMVIPSHFWLFVQGAGDPLQFMEACAELAPSSEAVPLTQGVPLLYVRE